MKSIFMIVLTIFCVYVTASYGGIEIDRIVAIVNNEIITLGELEKIVSIESKEAMKGIGDDKKLKVEEKLRKEVLKELIERRLQLQTAKRLGINVSKEEVKEAIEGIKKKNALDDANFEKALAKENMTLKEYEEQLRNQLIMTKLFNHEVRSKVVIAEKDIALFYENNKKDYLLIDHVKASHIFLKIPEKAGEKERDEIKVILEGILKKLKGGDDFGELARVYSQGPTAGSGGSLGILRKGEMTPELEKIAFSLKSGEMSDPIWTSDGVHILKIEERAEGNYRPSEEVKEEIRKVLIEKEAENRYREWISSLRDNSFIEIRL